MRKLKGILVLILFLALVASPIAVLASNISNALYYGTIIVTNNSTVATNVAVNCTISTQSLIDGGYLNASANNCVIRSSAGADLPFQPSVNASYPWCIWVPSIGQNASMADILYTANSSGGEIRYFPGSGGMTTADNTSLELGDNFTVEQKGWVDTSYDANKTLVNKAGAFLTYISATGNITSEIVGDTWVQAAPQLGAEVRIRSLAVHNSKLYGSTGVTTGELYEWNGVNLWVQKAPQLGAETDILSLAVHNDKIYGGTGVNGKLYEWNGVNLWVEKAPKLGNEIFIYSMVSYNGKLYGGTGTLAGALYEWNGANLWVLKAPQLGGETDINSLAVYNDKIYGGTGNNGKLYEWNGVNLWVEVAPQLGAESRIGSLVVYNDKLYGGTNPNGKLYEWNGVNLWVEVAPQLAETEIYSLEVFNGKLYGGTGNNGKLYEWNGVNAWVEVAPQLGAETRIFSLAAHDGKLYGGTGILSGELYEWNFVAITASSISSGEYRITTSANTTHFWIEKDGVTQDIVALAGASVPDNTSNWTFVQNDSMWYLEYQDIEIDGVQQQRIEWEYDDTTFTDLSAGNHDAYPTFRTTSSDSDVSAVLTSFLPVAEAQAPAYTLADAPAFIETVPVIVSQWVVTPVVGTFPLAEVIRQIALATATPPQLPLLLIAVFVILACSLAISRIMRQYGSGSLIVKIITITAVMGVFIALKNFGIDFWMLVVFLVVATALAMGSKQVGWQ